LVFLIDSPDLFTMNMREECTLGFGLFVDSIDDDLVSLSEYPDDSGYFALVISGSDFDCISSDDGPSLEGNLFGFVRFNLRGDIEGDTQ
jgi:hypothetical protein